MLSTYQISTSLKKIPGLKLTKEPTKEELVKVETLLLELIKSGSNSGVGIIYGRPWVDDIGPEYIFLNFFLQIGEHEDMEGNIYHIDAKNITAEYIDTDKQIFVQCRRCHEISLDSVAMHYPEKFGGLHGLHGCCDRPSATIPNGDKLLNAYAMATDKKFI